MYVMKTEVTGKGVSHLLNVFNTFNDVAAFHSLFNSISITQNPQVFNQRLLNQTGREGGEMSQIPQHLQHLIMIHNIGLVHVGPLFDRTGFVSTNLSSCSFRASFSANPPDQTEQLLPHAVALDLPALKNIQIHHCHTHTHTKAT